MYSLGVSEEILGRALKDFTKRWVSLHSNLVVIWHSTLKRRGGRCHQGILSNETSSKLRRIIKKTHHAIYWRLFEEIGNGYISEILSHRTDFVSDYVDILQIHRWDPDTPIEETVGNLPWNLFLFVTVFRGSSWCCKIWKGTIRWCIQVQLSSEQHTNLECSMSAWQFCKAILYARSRGFTEFISMQDHYNLIQREEEREMIPFCQSEGVGLIPWSPLAKGLLTGSRKKGTVIDGDTSTSDSRCVYYPCHFQLVPKRTSTPKCTTKRLW
jgi:aryl-alcohol dehydrogenase (NADP+)